MLEHFTVKKKDFNEILREKELQIELALENLKKTYTSYNSLKNNETESLYNNSQNQIEKIYADLFKLENSIFNESNKLSASMKQYENGINNNKKLYQSLLKKYNYLKNKDDASKPRSDEYDFILKSVKSSIHFHIIGSIILIYLLWKHYKKQ